MAMVVGFGVGDVYIISAFHSILHYLTTFNYILTYLTSQKSVEVKLSESPAQAWNVEDIAEFQSNLKASCLELTQIPKIT